MFGVVQALSGLGAFWIAQRLGYPAAVAQTMTFAVMGWSTVFMAAALRRDIAPVWSAPFVPYLYWLTVPFVLTWLAVDWDVLQPMLGTVALDGGVWGIVVGLSVLPLIVVEVEKWLHRLQTSAP